MMNWRFVLNRLLAIDDGKQIFGCRMDEMRLVRVLEYYSEEVDKKKKLIGCLPWLTGNSKNETCLYV